MVKSLHRDRLLKVFAALPSWVRDHGGTLRLLESQRC